MAAGFPGFLGRPEVPADAAAAAFASYQRAQHGEAEKTLSGPISRASSWLITLW